MRIILLALMLTGCTVRGEVTAPAQYMECRDTRDGEVWRYDTATVRDVRIDLLSGEASMSVTDTAGRVRIGSTADNVWLKCYPIGPAL